MRSLIVDTAEMVRQLDARGERWDLYRLATGGWAIQLGDVDTVDADTIEEALSRAVMAGRRTS